MSLLTGMTNPYHEMTVNDVFLDYIKDVKHMDHCCSQKIQATCGKYHIMHCNFLIYQNVFARKKKLLSHKLIASFALGHSILNCCECS